MKKKNNKSNKNIMKTIKILTIVLAIVLVSMVGFFGVYTQSKNQMTNKVKDYSYSMAINGARTIKLVVNSEEEEGTLTEENYNNVKKIIEKRLEKVGVEEYNISLNTQTGEVTIEIPENENTDKVVSNLSTVGKFEIIDTETNEVLLNNGHIESSDVLYNTTSTGTAVYLQIAFNKEGKSKLEEISRTYVEVEEDSTTVENNIIEDTNTVEEIDTITEETTTSTTETTEEATTEKTITMKIDDEEIMSTSFEEPITTGKIQLSVGTATTDTSTLQDYILQAQNVAIVLDSGNLPIQYDIEKNEYILSNVNSQNLVYIAVAIAIVVVVGIIVLIVKHKLNGLLAGIAYVGLAAIYVLIIRYTNVIVSFESIFGIAAILALNYIFTEMLLNNIEKISKEVKENVVNKATKETYIKFFIRIIPICIMVIAFCFVKWVPVSSFGMTSFWGLAIIAIYNVIITRTLLKIKSENK